MKCSISSRLPTAEGSPTAHEQSTRSATSSWEIPNATSKSMGQMFYLFFLVVTTQNPLFPTTWLFDSPPIFPSTSQYHPIISSSFYHSRCRALHQSADRVSTRPEINGMSSNPRSSRRNATTRACPTRMLPMTPVGKALPLRAELNG